MFLALILQNFKQNKFADSRKSFLNCTALGKICLSRLWLKLDLIWPLIDYILFLAFKTQSNWKIVIRRHNETSMDIKIC